MRKNKFNYIFLAGLLGLASCSEEQLQPGSESRTEGRVIMFRASLPESETRAEIVEKFQKGDSICITSFYPDDKNSVNPYFENQKFIQKDATGTIFTPVVNRNCLWPETAGKLEFFAFYPTLPKMRESVGNEYSGPEYFKLTNNSSRSDTDDSLSIDYSINKFRVSKDIPNQIDFISARNSVEIPEIQHNSDGSVSAASVALTFQHQLSRIIIEATKGSNETYNFEVAGIRIGNPVLEGSFQYKAKAEGNASTPDSVGNWILGDSPVKKSIEYIFQPGETIVTLSGNDSVSIMGKGKCAMVIPATIEKWEMPEYSNVPPTNDSEDATTEDGSKYATKQMYFSVLMNVTKSDGTQVYPYETEDAYADYDKMNVINLEVDNEGKILSTSNPEGNGTAIPKAFGWAAVPVSVEWAQGQSYKYILDYSNGIGFHDPEDPEPGRPIKESEGVSIKVIVEHWVDATDYNKEITVPVE